MKLTKKQLTLGTLAAVTAVAVPVATVVSCGNKAEENKVEAFTINLEQVNSVQGLMDKLNSQYHFFMDQRADKLGEIDPNNADASRNNSTLTQKGFDNIKKYVEGFDFSKIKVKMTFKGKTFEYDFSKLKGIIESVKSELSKSDAFKQTREFDAQAAMKNESPTISGYVANMAGLLLGLKLTGVPQLKETTFNTWNTSLDAYHAFVMDFTKNDVYKEWITGKTFNIIDNDGVDPKKPTKTVNPGDGYDKHPHAIPNLAQKTKNFATESSNFEAVLAANIMGFYL